VNIVKEPDAEVVAPRFVKTYLPRSVVNDEAVIFETEATSNPTPSFTWSLNAKPIVSGEDDMHIAQIENKSILIIERASKNITGEVTCRAENVAGSVTYTASMNVLDVPLPDEAEFAPEFQELPTPVQVMDGEEIRLQCKVVGHPTPLVTWSHKKRGVKRRSDVHITQDTRGVCTLLIKEAFPELAGEYEIVATNRCGKATIETQVAVEGMLCHLCICPPNNIRTYVSNQTRPLSNLHVVTFYVPIYVFL
jgi:hypothetical protein